MAANPLYDPHPHEVSGHPVRELYLVADQEPTLITVCAECGQLRTILFLSKDRWFCTKCRAAGATAPNLYPIA
jgi:ribosomal protein S27AE